MLLLPRVQIQSIVKKKTAHFTRFPPLRSPGKVTGAMSYLLIYVLKCNFSQLNEPKHLDV